MADSSIPSPEPIHVDGTNAKEIFKRYDAVIFDMDGVLWGPDHSTTFPGVDIAVRKLHEAGKHIFFVTNNCLMERQYFKDRLRDLAHYEAHLDDIISMAWVTATYIKYVAKITGKCYVIGNQGLQVELDAVGIEYTGIGQDLDAPLGRNVVRDIFKVTLDEDIQAVIVGYDSHFHYNKLVKACNYLKNEECPFFAATNDSYIDMKDRVFPLTAGIVASIESTIKRAPTLVGKPSALAFDCVKVRNPDVTAERTLMIGDTPRNDMQFANNSGMDSLMVLSGTGSLEELEGIRKQGLNNHLPTYVATSVVDLGEWL